MLHQVSLSFIRSLPLERICGYHSPASTFERQDKLSTIVSSHLISSSHVLVLNTTSQPRVEPIWAGILPSASFTDVSFAEFDYKAVSTSFMEGGEQCNV